MTHMQVVPGSSWAERMLARVTAHVDAEREFLESYQRLAAEAPEGYVRYLLRLVYEDEVRHHQLFLEMANRLTSDVEWQPLEPATPSARESGAPGAHEATRGEVDRFIAGEKDDLRELRRLRKDLGDMEGSLFPVLLQTMELDTQKHILVLEFIRRSLS